MPNVTSCFRSGLWVCARRCPTRHDRPLRLPKPGDTGKSILVLYVHPVNPPRPTTEEPFAPGAIGIKRLGRCWCQIRPVRCDKSSRFRHLRMPQPSGGWKCGQKADDGLENGTMDAGILRDSDPSETLNFKEPKKGDRRAADTLIRISERTA
jgi:hypothetical protein